MKRFLIAAGSTALFLAYSFPAQADTGLLQSELATRAQIEASIRQSLQSLAYRNPDRLMSAYAHDFQERMPSGEVKNYDEVRADVRAFTNTLQRFPNRTFRLDELSTTPRTATAVVVYNVMADTREPDSPVMRVNDQMRVRYHYVRVGDDWLLRRAEVLEQHPIIHTRW